MREEGMRGGGEEPKIKLPPGPGALWRAEDLHPTNVLKGRINVFVSLDQGWSGPASVFREKHFHGGDAAKKE